MSPKDKPLVILSGEITWRIVYRADADGLVVVDVFAKKTQATPKQAIARCKQRLRDWDRDE